MTEDRLVSLIARQIAGELRPGEFQELADWAAKSGVNRTLLSRISDEEILKREINIWKSIDLDKGFNHWLMAMRARRRFRMARIVGFSVAASLLVTVVLVSLISQRHSANVEPVTEVVKRMQPVVVPGKNAATLTLADGRQILLDSVGKGVLGMQGSNRVVKIDDGSLSYMATNDANPEMGFNVLTTPRSGQYRLTLPDGTRVWLNNVSSLRYPMVFQDKERRVELTGEAYFEIARNMNQPFVVEVKNATIHVLGTSFNIMAYPEEGGAQTTLLTGAVQVNTSDAGVTLKPDEQAQVKENGTLKIVKGVAGADIVSWKDGFFYFGRASFAAVMRQLARWYDVDVIYEGKAPTIEFGGKIDRSLALNDLLKFLDKNQIHFRLDGRKLIVLPN